MARIRDMTEGALVGLQDAPSVTTPRIAPPPRHAGEEKETPTFANRLKRTLETSVAGKARS
jgi:hypothetical protein